MLIAIDALTPMSRGLIEQHVKGEGDLFELARKVTGIMFEPPTQSNIVAYQGEFRAYLQEHNDVAVMRGLTFSISLLLENSGLGNAEDIDIDFHLSRRRVHRGAPPVASGPPADPSCRRCEIRSTRCLLMMDPIELLQSARCLTFTRCWRPKFNTYPSRSPHSLH